MARICSICEKRPRVGNLVSHANNRTKRWLYPNVHTMRFTLTNDPKGNVYRAAVCTKCVKAKKVQKVF
ncbi:MAG: 50S ribosomal protein L28 [candidate division TM6 bacterium GW2011_GWF2_32_72]|nr:MAG: 50S ribosomal protein L28 [candidate division TM6 bacterium GW2011_GWF2_32_72]